VGYALACRLASDGKLKHNATRFSKAAISGDIVPRPGLVTPAVFAAGSFLCLDFSLKCAITQKNRRQDRRRYRAKTGDLEKNEGH
jgi:hypothetical protein